MLSNERGVTTTTWQHDLPKRQYPTSQHVVIIQKTMIWIFIAMKICPTFATG